MKLQEKWHFKKCCNRKWRGNSSCYSRMGFDIPILWPCLYYVATAYQAKPRWKGKSITLMDLQVGRIGHQLWAQCTFYLTTCQRFYISGLQYQLNYRHSARRNYLGLALHQSTSWTRQRQLANHSLQIVRMAAAIVCWQLITHNFGLGLSEWGSEKKNRRRFDKKRYKEKC